MVSVLTISIIEPMLKNNILSSIDKSIKENRVLCITLNDTKNMICLVCFCFRKKTKVNNLVVMTTWIRLLFCTFVVRLCIWFFFLPVINYLHQLTNQHHSIDVDSTRIYVEFLSAFEIFRSILSQWLNIIRCFGQLLSNGTN